MDNQHKLIKGYRDLTQDEIDHMNKIKEVGALLETLVEQIGKLPDVDKRWLAMANTDLQVGVMKLVRAVARPTSF